MRRMISLAWNNRGLSSAFAALSLAGSAVLVSSVATVPAAAQEQSQPELKPSRNFARVYQPLADIANSDGGDYASARAQLPAVNAAVDNADDRYMAGMLTYLLGAKLEDAALATQGMEAMLASGKALPAAVAEIHYFLGEQAYNAQDWAKARTHLQAAQEAGYTTSNPDGLIAESYFKGGQPAEGLAFMKQRIESYRAAGNPVPNGWIVRALQVSLEHRLNDQANEWSALLVASSPTPENWGNALRVVIAANALEGQALLDNLRLMALTDALTRRDEFERYVAMVDPRVLATEAEKVLQAGVSKGVLNASDEFYTDNIRITADRKKAEPSLAAEYAAEAGGASDGRPAFNAGEVYLSLAQYDKAEEMFRIAVEKGGPDRGAMLTRLGIAQVGQGKLSEARSNFEQVSGNYAPVARMWAAYTESRA